jgi:transposase InsO family protein
LRDPLSSCGLPLGDNGNSEKESRIMANLDPRQAKDATLDWMLWYNGSRMHSTLGYLSPAQFEQQADTQRLALAA